MDLLDYKSYKIYLNQVLHTEPHGRGAQTRLAQHIRCQPAFISQVLKGPSHFSLEQAQDVNFFLGHSKEKSRYFLTLVQFERSGSPELKKFFENELMALKEESLDLRKRLTYEKILSKEDQTIYFSSWIYAGLHALVSIPNLQKVSTLSTYLGIELSILTPILEFLVSRGLVLEKDGRLKPGVTQVHVGKDSPLSRQHHINLRHKALQSFDLQAEGTLHYSSLVTMSREDALEVRAELTKCIERIRGRIKVSKDEAAFCYLIDFFPVTHFRSETS